MMIVMIINDDVIVFTSALERFAQYSADLQPTNWNNFFNIFMVLWFCELIQKLN